MICATYCWYLITIISLLYWSTVQIEKEIQMFIICFLVGCPQEEDFQVLPCGWHRTVDCNLNSPNWSTNQLGRSVDRHPTSSPKGIRHYGEGSKAAVWAPHQSSPGWWAGESKSVSTKQKDLIYLSRHHFGSVLNQRLCRKSIVASLLMYCSLHNMS